MLHDISGLQRANPKIISESCSHDRVLDHGRAAPGIEPGTSRTQRENRTTRPNSRLDRIRPMKNLRIKVCGITRKKSLSRSLAVTFETLTDEVGSAPRFKRFLITPASEHCLLCATTPCGTRTRNHLIRSPTPCPLRQGGRCIMYMSSFVHSCERGTHNSKLLGSAVRCVRKPNKNN